MLISFIVSTYNLPEALLKECLESIKSLPIGRGDYELIVVDDGSLHSSEGLVRSVFPQGRFIAKSNGGLSSARNAGLDAAKGDYIQFVDGDDMLLPSYRNVISILQGQHPDIVMFKLSRQKQGKTDEHYEQSEATSGAEFMLSHNLRASACGYIARRKLIAETRFPIGLLHEDEEFTPFVMVKSESVIATNLRPYYYRERENSITQTKDEAHLRRRLDNTFTIISHLRDATNALCNKQKDALERRIAHLSLDYLYNTLTLLPSQLKKSADNLKSIGLFPLPKGKYTIKQSLLRIFINALLG